MSMVCTRSRSQCTDSAECAWLGEDYSCRHTVSKDTCAHEQTVKHAQMSCRQALTVHFAMCALDSAPWSPSHACLFFLLLDARPLATKATPKVQTERHKEDRRDIFVVSRSRSMDLNCKMVRNGEVVAVHKPSSTTQS